MLPRVCSAIDHRWRPPSSPPLPKMKRKRGNVYENLASVSPLGGGGGEKEGTATCRLPKPKVETDKPYRDLDHSGYHYKTESNTCFIIHWTKESIESKEIIHWTKESIESKENESIIIKVNRPLTCSHPDKSRWTILWHPLPFAM